MSVNQSERVKGRKVDDVLLDAGCSPTMVHQEVVPESRKILGKGVSTRCSQGDSVSYPLADLDMMVDGVKLKVTAVVSEKNIC